MANNFWITQLKLSNYRNHKFLQINPTKNIILITGRNGSGKTNVLESISLFDSTTNTYSSSVYVINTNALATNTADLNTFSGEVLYYDNILPATRTNSSTENVRLIVKV